MIIASKSHLFSCFCIKGEGGIGTAFAYQQDGRTFFLTAKHVIGGAIEGGLVYFKRLTRWEPYELTGTTSHPEGQDVATFGVRGLSIEVQHNFSHEDDPYLGLGQEVKFLGFPHGLENTAESDIGFSTPLVRTAFFSGFITDPTNGRRLIILDGLNNPGYSGGPIWAPGADTERPTLLGLISGYRIEDRGKSRVYEQGDDGERVVPNMFVKPNSGMIHAIGFGDIQQLVDVSTDTNEAL